MTNFEFYEEQIKAVDYKFGVTEKGEIVACDTCGACKFSYYKDHPFICKKHVIEWLYEEHTEKPTLTPNERKFCEIIAFKYLVREEDGRLFAYANEPKKSDTVWHSGFNNLYITPRIFKGCDFSFIKWEDNKAWSVEDLLKLEVAE